MTAHSAASAPVTGSPALILRAEGAALLAAAVVAYAVAGAGWWVFALAFLLPDIAMLGYLRGPRLGAVTYNLAHATVLPLALTATGWFAATPALLAAGLIWLAHVGFDRMLGYGLKYPTAFGDTHLGRKGRADMQA